MGAFPIEAIAFMAFILANALACGGGGGGGVFGAGAAPGGGVGGMIAREGGLEPGNGDAGGAPFGGGVIALLLIALALLAEDPGRVSCKAFACAGGGRASCGERLSTKSEPYSMSAKARRSEPNLRLGNLSATDLIPKLL